MLFGAHVSLLYYGNLTMCQNNVPTSIVWLLVPILFKYWCFCALHKIYMGDGTVLDPLVVFGCYNHGHHTKDFFSQPSVYFNKKLFRHTDVLWWTNEVDLSSTLWCCVMMHNFIRNFVLCTNRFMVCSQPFIIIRATSSHYQSYKSTLQQLLTDRLNSKYQLRLWLW